VYEGIDRRPAGLTPPTLGRSASLLLLPPAAAWSRSVSVGPLTAPLCNGLRHMHHPVKDHFVKLPLSVPSMSFRSRHVTDKGGKGGDAELEEIRRRWVGADAEHLPFADGAFDAAYANLFCKRQSGRCPLIEQAPFHLVSTGGRCRDRTYDLRLVRAQETCWSRA
jgi:hypothetical protein